MKERRILYELGDSARDQFMYAIQKELQQKMPHQAFFKYGEYSHDIIKNEIYYKNILYLDYKNQKEIKVPDMTYLKKAEEGYNFNVWDSWEISAQRKKSRREIPPNNILIWYEYIIKQFSQFLETHEITDYIMYGPASFASIIIMKILEERKINIIELQSSPLKKRFGISNDLRGSWPLLIKNYQEIKMKGISKCDKEKSLEYLKRYHLENYEVDCSTKYNEPKLQKISRYSKLAWNMIKHNHYPPSFRPIFWGVIQKSYDQMDLFEEPIENEKFVLFPLHFQPESTTLIYGKWYNNQLNLIENLVRSIPVGYKLYIKEHSYGYGNRNIKFYKEIKKYQNVRLIIPRANSLDLIKKSSLIFTITGTIGWEAIMLQKPIIIFGDVYYDILDPVTKIYNIRDLPKIVKKLIDTEIKYEETIQCMTAMIKSTYPGLARLPTDSNNHSLEKENIKCLVEGIYHSLNGLNYEL